MTKAQKVRIDRLNAINALTQQAEEIFDWILDLIDSDTKQGTFEPINLYLNTSGVIVRFNNLDGEASDGEASDGEASDGEASDGEASDCNAHYVLKRSLPKYSSIQLFTTLKEVIKLEEGFDAVIEKDIKLGIIMHVAIE